MSGLAAEAEDIDAARRASTGKTTFNYECEHDIIETSDVVLFVMCSGEQK